MDQSATFIGIVLLALTQIGTFILTMRKVAGVSETRRIEPQPLEVRAAADYMTRGDCTRMHNQNALLETQRFDAIEKQLRTFEARIAELTAALERRNQEGEARASRIHVRVDSATKEIAELRGQVVNHIEHGAHNA